MRVGEIRELIRMKPVELDATRRRLSSCHDIDDLRSAARRRIPRPVFDYVDGGSDEEISMRANREAFQRWRFRPRLLADVSEVETAATVLDRNLPLPLILGPTGYTRMMHPGGEIAVARSAARHGLPYTLSTMSTTTIEKLAEAVPRPDQDDKDLWFQLYFMRDADVNKDLIARAADAGYRVLMVTVDTAVPGRRIRDERNGLIIPPALTAGTLASIAAHPGYWTSMLRNPAIAFANLPVKAKTIANSGSMFDPALNWGTIEDLRQQWPGKLILKGPLGPEDATRAIRQHNVDGIVLSNHGGRQLDRAVAPIDLVPSVREAIGSEPTLLVDSGVRHGSDIAVAIALGADGVAIGRAYLYGLMAGGEHGVDKTIDVLHEQFTRTLQLLGAHSTRELRTAGEAYLGRYDISPLSIDFVGNSLQTLETCPMSH